MVNFSLCMAGLTSKQGIATHGSTESEILGVAEEIGHHTKRKVQNRQTGTISTNVAEYQKDGLIKVGWILLDNQSTVNVFYDKRMLRNIRKVSCWMDIHCNAGKARTDLIGDLPGFGAIWYHKNGIANILSRTKVERMKGVEHVSYHTKMGRKFIVTKKDGIEKYFEQSDQGLHFLDAMK